MNRVNRIFYLFFLLTIFFSCEEQGLFVKCPDCTAEEPETAELEINFDVGVYTIPFPIKIYEGNLEDSILYKTLAGGGTRTTTKVPLNKKYTVTATYYIAGSYYVTVDSAYPRVTYTKDQCDDPCFFVYDRIVDLRLKYGK